MDLALLIVRILVGLGFATHGAQKLFGWFGGYGIKGTGGFFASIGFPMGPLFAFLAGCGEFFGGVLVALGLGGPIGPGLMIPVMVVATITVHLPNGFLATKNGFELPLMYSCLAVLFAFGGYGVNSLDAMWGLTRLTTGLNATVAILAALVAGLLAAMMRRRPEGKG